MRYVRYLETKFMLCHAFTLPRLAALRYPSARYNSLQLHKISCSCLHPARFLASPLAFGAAGELHGDEILEKRW